MRPWQTRCGRCGMPIDYYNGLSVETPTSYLDVLKNRPTSKIDGVQNLVQGAFALSAVLEILIGQQLMQGENPQQSRGT